VRRQRSKQLDPPQAIAQAAAAAAAGGFGAYMNPAAMPMLGMRLGGGACSLLRSLLRSLL